jgi:hypothetical protein
MDRKALAILIVVLSSLVILVLVNLSQPPPFPIPSPTAPTVEPVKPPIMMLNLSDSMAAPQNATATPTPLPTVDRPLSSQSSHETPAPTAQPTPSPSALQPWVPATPMQAWSPMPVASPLTW